VVARRAAIFVLACGAAAACRPDFGARESLVTRLEILAMRADPPEAAPGESVTYTLLVASPAGTVDAPPAAWSFCAAPKLLAENELVSRACLAGDARSFGAFAGPAQARIPADACALFGPETPPGDLRPKDPDATGGYYQPVRADLAQGVTAFGVSRIACNIAHAPADVAKELHDRYRRNQNPTLEGVRATIDGAHAAIDHIPAGAHVRLATGWAARDAEAFLLYDPGSQGITLRRESMRVSWFVTAGTLDADRTGRAAEDPSTTTENGWRAPTVPGPAYLWLVLRDSRGGTAFLGERITVVAP
jgi:hypothetical protein